MTCHTSRQWRHIACTADKPMPAVERRGNWHHPDARETDYDGDNYIEYQCPHCNHVFTVEMPD